MTTQNERNYFYRTLGTTPTPQQFEQTLEHLMNREPSQRELAELEQRLRGSQNSYAPGGDVHQRTRRVIR